MVATTDLIAETTDGESLFDPLDDALRSLRISGSVLLREPYAPPWAIAIPSSARLGELLGAGPGVRAVAFHLVEYGRCRLEPEGGDPLLLQAGSVAVCFGGAAHRLADGGRTRTQPVESLLAGRREPPRPSSSVGTPATALLCGAFFLRHADLNPLVAALPPVLSAGLSRPGSFHNLSGVARLMADEIDRRAPGSAFVVERLLEVLCAEVVRAHVEAVPTPGPGWIRALKDPVVGRAIARLHRDPGRRWSVALLAREAAISPSRLAARFAESLGMSPMAYLGRWRMDVACRMLASTDRGVEEVGRSLGYDSPAAFSRAFRKIVGVAPASWRSRWT